MKLAVLEVFVSNNASCCSFLLSASSTKKVRLCLVHRARRRSIKRVEPCVGETVRLMLPVIDIQCCFAGHVKSFKKIP
jgi:hypothetical protein